MNRIRIHPSTREELLPTTTTNLVKDELTWFLSFKDPLKNAQYTEFRRSSVSLRTFGIFQTIFTLSSMFSKLNALMYYHGKKNISYLLLINLTVGIIFAVVFGWMVFGIHYLSKNCRNKVTIKMRTVWFPIIENIWLIGSMISLQLSLASMIEAEENIRFSIATSFIPFILFTSFIAVIIVNGISGEVAILSSILNVVILLSFVLTNLRDALPVFSWLVPMYFLGIYEFKRQNLSTFLTAQKLEDFENQNERLEKELQSSVLKHLIGNVAHDLKTVSCELF